METGQSLEDVHRHSQRHCEPPKRLQKSKLGNSLSLNVEPLLQWLSTAFAISEEPDSLGDTCLEMPGGYPPAVTMSTGTCISSKQGECNMGNPGNQ